jgi:hypothetical protein
MLTLSANPDAVAGPVAVLVAIFGVLAAIALLWRKRR